MELIEAIKQRHSVRSYTDRPIDPETVNRLQELINECNAAGRLHMQLVTGEPRSFGESRMARYGNFSGVSNYIAVVGTKDSTLDERAGYYGEKVVLRAQQLGLNTCWVGLTYKKIGNALTIEPGEKLVCVIALGYGANEGATHKIKTPEQVSAMALETAPEWYRRGIESALLAPTAMNQQKFKFALHDGNRVSVKAGLGFYAKVDLGIVRYHFEIGAGTGNFTWAR